MLGKYFYQRKAFICAIPLFSTIKELCFVHTSVGVKYNKTIFHTNWQQCFKYNTYRKFWQQVG